MGKGLYLLTGRRGGGGGGCGGERPGEENAGEEVAGYMGADRTNTDSVWANYSLTDGRVECGCGQGSVTEERQVCGRQADRRRLPDSLRRMALMKEYTRLGQLLL